MLICHAGLRTLCMASKTLSRSDYIEWNKKFQAAANSIENREDKIDQVANLIENVIFNFYHYCYFLSFSYYHDYLFRILNW